MQQEILILGDFFRFFILSIFIDLHRPEVLVSEFQSSRLPAPWLS